MPIENAAKSLTFEEWRQELIAVSAKETGLQEYQIKINDSSAMEFYKDGFTPYQTFRETWSNENDSE